MENEYYELNFFGCHDIDVGDQAFQILFQEQKYGLIRLSLSDVSLSHQSLKMLY